MGFEAFIQSFTNGELSGIPIQKVRDAFEPFVKETGPADWRLQYGENDYSDVALSLVPTDHNLIFGFTVDRPCGNDRLWDALASILQLGNLVIYFPSTCPPLVANSTVAGHLPSSMIEAMGEPKCVGTGKEILKELKTAG